MAALPFRHVDHHLLPAQGALSAEADVPRSIFCQQCQSLLGGRPPPLLPCSFLMQLPASSRFPGGLAPPIFHQNLTKVTLWQMTCTLHPGVRMKARLEHVLSCLGLYLLLIDLRDRLPSSAEAWTVILGQHFFFVFVFFPRQNKGK